MQVCRDLLLNALCTALAAAPHTKTFFISVLLLFYMLYTLQQQPFKRGLHNTTEVVTMLFASMQLAAMSTQMDPSTLVTFGISIHTLAFVIPAFLATTSALQKLERVNHFLVHYMPSLKDYTDAEAIEEDRGELLRLETGPHFWEGLRRANPVELVTIRSVISTSPAFLDCDITSTSLLQLTTNRLRKFQKEQRGLQRASEATASQEAQAVVIGSHQATSTQAVRRSAQAVGSASPRRILVSAARRSAADEPRPSGLDHSAGTASGSAQ